MPSTQKREHHEQSNFNSIVSEKKVSYKMQTQGKIVLYCVTFQNKMMDIRSPFMCSCNFHKDAAHTHTHTLIDISIQKCEQTMAFCKRRADKHSKSHDYDTTVLKSHSLCS